MGITQKEIARALGISLITVSRTLNNTGYVSPGMRKKITEYAQKQSYIPNRASRSLVRKEPRIIGVFSSATPEYFWTDIQKGTALAAGQIHYFNYRVHFYNVPDFDTRYFKRLLKREIKKGLSAAAFANIWLFDMEAIFNIADTEGIPWILYNVDAPGSKRLCYIGTDYPAGGRLAANFIGKALDIKTNGTVLVINIREDADRLVWPDINALRSQGFTDKMNECYPCVKCHVEHINSLPPLRDSQSQIRNILTRYQGKADAVYFIPALNTPFLHELERLDYRNAITVLHDIEASSLQGLRSGLLTAAVYQDPVLQGYRSVKTLESILESKDRSRRQDIKIAHSLIFRENIEFLDNFSWLEK
ncbi:MAG: LacI family transcriptional regulator [Treponema sp.]|jgi:LacI family transcriptional regulator|nr:LacI family transcriptional regulator [Treponema sp.]